MAHHNKAASPENPDNEALLEIAANNTYHAILEDEEDEEDEDITWLREYRLRHKSLHWTKRPSAITLGIILCTAFMGLIAVETSVQTIMTQKACNSLITSPGGDCNPEDVQVFLSRYNSISVVMASGMSMMTASKIGQMSDIYGRKPFIIFIFCSLMAGISWSVYLLSHYDTFQFVPMLLAEGVVSNLGGSTVTLLGLAKAYITDATESHERIYSMGLMQASTQMGSTLAPLFVMLTLKFSPALPTKVNAAENTFQTSDSRDFIPIKWGLVFVFIVLVYLTFALPESRSERARMRLRKASSTPVDAAASLDQLQSRSTPFYKSLNWKPLLVLTYPDRVVIAKWTPDQIKRIRVAFISLAGTSVIVGAFMQGVSLNLVQYGIYRFGWTTVGVSAMTFLLGGTRTVFIVFISPFVVNYGFRKLMKFKVLKNQVDMVDFSLLTFSMIAEFTGLFLGALAHNSGAFFTAIVIVGLGGMTDPALASTCVKFLPETKVGEFFGAMALAQNALAIISPIICTQIYSFGLKHSMAGLLFFCAGGMVLGSFLLLVMNKVRIGLDTETVEAEPLMRSRSASRNLQPEI